MVIGIFLAAEITLAFVGGLSALMLFWSFTVMGEYYVVSLVLSCTLVGALVGLEIPLLIRILEKRVEVRVAISHVLALDYVGALVASIAFPLLLLPYMGAVWQRAKPEILDVRTLFMGVNGSFHND